MTRTPLEVLRALRLTRAGFTETQISRCLDIPRSTVRDWVQGRVPARILHHLSQGSCPSCGHPIHRMGELPAAYAYLLGLYLGDGSISRHPRGVFKLRLTLDAAYPRIIDEAAHAMQTVLPRNKVGRIRRPDHSVEVYSQSKSWPCFFPQHGPGKKHLRSITLIPWQMDLVRRTPDQLLRGLIHSDGCRSMNTGRNWQYPRYSFRNLSPDIRGIFTDTCDMLGIRWTSAPNVVYVSRVADVDLLDRFVGPKR